jgi:glycine cleavage system aminomethyltransferase T/glycine/D-amino acid oxidase-like deaminating enzyme
MGRRIVIIGAGVVGAALADELTALGETSVTVLDKGPLYATGGSSSHAPGLISRTSPSKMMQAFADYTLVKFGGLDLDGELAAHPVGTLEVALNQDRLRELQRRCASAFAWGWEGRMISAEEAVDQWPIIDGTRLLGAFSTEDEGLAVSLRAVEAQARRAQARGATFVGDQEVLGIEHAGGRVSGVLTSGGVVPADVVVCCAGVWGPAVADMVGLTLPMVAFQHQYVVTTPIAELADNAEREATLPIIRHHDAGLYFRDHGDKVGIGSFNHRTLPVAVTDLDSHPGATDLVFPFTPEDLAEPWELACELMPALRGAQLERSFNGVFAFTPDGYPLMGEHPELPGFWVAESVWVTHSAGVARSIAESLVHGTSSEDASPADLTRFHDVELAPEVYRARCDDSYRDVYAVHHPAEGHTSARELRWSPFVERQRELGAEFFDGAAWERPRWYESNRPLLEGLRLPARDAWAGRHWSPIVAAEHLATRERAGLFDMTPLTRIDVQGAGAEAFLLWMCAGPVDRPVGSVTYTVLLDSDGGIRSDVTVARLAEDRFVIGANGPRDVIWLQTHAPREVTVSDTTERTCCAGLWGPAAPSILTEASQDDLSFPYLSVRSITVGEIPVTATRISYAGELGWELVAAHDDGQALWDRLWTAGQAHGLVAAGSGALASLRLEKGYRAWGADITPEHGPAESGLGFTVRRDGPEFLGMSGLAERAPSEQRLVCLVLDGEQVVMGGEPVFVEERAAGYVTSAAFGSSVGRSIAYAWVPASLGTGDRVRIRYFDHDLDATLADEPLFDPKGERPRA